MPERRVAPGDMQPAGGVCNQHSRERLPVLRIPTTANHHCDQKFHSEGHGEELLENRIPDNPVNHYYDFSMQYCTTLLDKKEFVVSLNVHNVC